MEIEGFPSIISTLHLAKELHNIDRQDVLEHFADSLCWDGYYENILAVLTNIFFGFYSDYDDCYDAEMMIFEDDVISNYFVHAYEQIKLQKLHYEENQYVTQAMEEARRWLNCNTCVDWRLLAYTKSKKNAMRSKLIVSYSTSCGCNASENIAYGLIKLYDWFFKKCAEFNALEVKEDKAQEKASNIYEKNEIPEVMAA